MLLSRSVLSFFNPFPPRDWIDTFERPYKEGWVHLSVGICKREFQQGHTLSKRVIHIITGLFLLIPLVNIVISVAMRNLSSVLSTEVNKWEKRLFECIRRDSYQEFIDLIEEGQKKNFLNQKSDLLDGTILHDLAKLPQFTKYITPLIEKGIDLSVQDWGQGNTALMWSIANAINSSAMLIIQRGGPGKHLDMQCNIGNSALHLAVGKGYKKYSYDQHLLEFSNLELVEALIENKAKVNLQNKERNTPLHLAFLRRDKEMILALKQAGADMKIKNKEGKTPQELSELGYEGAYKILLATVNVFLLDKDEYDSALLT